MPCVIPYAPRPLQRQFHEQRTRFCVLLCHRRFGKTVAAVNDLIREALRRGKADWRAAYAAPFLGQAKAVAWDYCRRFAGAVLEKGASYAFSVRCPVGPVYAIGDAKSPALEIAELAGGVLTGAELVIQVMRGGGRNTGTFRLSTDGGDNYGKARTIPVNGIHDLADFGVTITFPEGEYPAGTTYTCRLLPPAPSIVDVLDALETPLNLFDVEFVHIVGDSDSVDWLAAQAKAEELWNLQRPTYFKLEARLPRDGEDMSAYAAALLAERQGVACRFVTVCCQYGELVDSTGAVRLRNAGGLRCRWKRRTTARRSTPPRARFASWSRRLRESRASPMGRIG